MKTKAFVKVFFSMLTVSVLFFAAGCSREKIFITGSETMYPMLNLVANDFNSTQTDIEVVVRGGGSKYGLKQLISNRTHFASSSSGLVEDIELQLKYIDNFTMAVMAYDGVSIVVNKKNRVEKLRLTQISGIFSGKIKNWKDVGGPDKPITVIVRNDYSGTATFMRENVLRQHDLGEMVYEKYKYTQYAKNAIVAKNNREIADRVAADENAVSFMGMGSAVTEGRGKVKVLMYARTEKDPFHYPSVHSVESGRYQLKRPLMLIYRPDKGGSMTRFVEYLKTDRARLKIENSGYLDTLYSKLFTKTIQVKARRLY